MSTLSEWAPVIRYAEVLLNYAKASARLSAGVDADVVEKLNMVTAPLYTVASFATKQEMINAILGESRIELAFEGHGYFDLKKTKSDIVRFDSDRTTFITVAYRSDKIYSTNSPGRG